jgi:hypothetical protein
MSRRINAYSYIRVTHNVTIFRQNFVSKRTGLIWGFIENPFNKNRDFAEDSQPGVFRYLGNIPEQKINEINTLIGYSNWEFV